MGNSMSDNSNWGGLLGPIALMEAGGMRRGPMEGGNPLPPKMGKEERIVR